MKKALFFLFCFAKKEKKDTGQKLLKIFIWRLQDIAEIENYKTFKNTSDYSLKNIYNFYL
jgi:hypothetical protein